ncbi:hypothetical protein HU830_06200 [Lactobacillus sp. DCY120]|uniref:Uncharacterized protein n=1 Tax=Bombilactobacillus apium TaxID=2675299 RepID=A0A850RBQ5_9LACO|nr:hypothetical protein [Bombilactobacillus apium]NVY96746.1 hypothetical protein [Bombilactobacillus apium]
MTTLAAKNWNFGQPISLSELFAGCNQLTELDLNGWTMGQVTDLSSLSEVMKNLQRLHLTIGMFPM